MYELQKIDLTWVKVARRLQQVQQQLGESEELRNARQTVAKTEAEMHQWRGRQTNAELESKSLADKIKSTEERLMSGAVRNPKELDALQANLEALRRHRALVDDHAVEALMQAEELQKTLGEQQSTLTSLEESWNSGQSELRETEAKLKQNYVLLKRKREAVAGSLQASLLERYEHMRKRKAGVAVAEVQNGVCGACHVQLPTGIVNGLRGGNGELVPCPSCGRYLVAGQPAAT
jgi:predicted  nucleic acid-binding Zn-ribbon protein